MLDRSSCAVRIAEIGERLRHAVDADLAVLRRPIDLAVGSSAAILRIRSRVAQHDGTLSSS